MSTELTVAEPAQPPARIEETGPMFGRAQLSGQGMNVGAVAIEQERAIAEAQGQLILAKRFPRSVAAATAEFLDSCKSREFAESAFYTVPNRGSGPSIRFAEEAARCYGNFKFGHRELSRSEGKSEIEVYAWDMEKNNHSTRQVTVLHLRDKQGGATPLKDQTDIDNRIANVASKQMRGRILAILPKSMIEAGKAVAKATLAGANDKPVSQRITDMTVVFGRYGVTPAMLETRLGHKIEQTTVDELADLHGIYNAIKEGEKASEFFGGSESESDKPANQAERITKAAAKTKAEPENKPKAEPESKDEKPSPKEETKAPPKEENKPAVKEAEPAKEAAPPPTEDDGPAEDNADADAGGAADDKSVF